MKPAKFDYIAPESLEAAVAALAAAGGEGKVMAGGQSLMPLLNFRMTRPAVIVDLRKIPGLAYIDERADVIAVGAMTRHCELEHSPLIRSRLPVVTEAMRHVAHLAIRNRGTIGGSLSHADPAAELPMLAVLYDASLRIIGPGGRRIVRASEFFVSALTTCLEADEIVCEIEFPVKKHHTAWSFHEVSRRSGDFALAAIAVSLARTGNAIADCHVAVTGVGDTPRRLADIEVQLRGQGCDEAACHRFAAAVRDAVSPQDDIHASADYRRSLIHALAGRALAEAFDQAGRVPT